MAQDLVAVLDVGKSNVKLSVVEAQSAQTVSRAEHPTRVLDGPIIPQLDVAGIEEWTIATLADTPSRERIRCVVPVAHGATAALVDGAGEVLVVADYESAEFDAVADAYRAERDPFEATCSPFLPRGLNLGRQLFHLELRHRSVFERAAQVLLYPQYWAWRLSGIATSEVTSLGCHTDLWRPREARYSQLAQRHGWDALLPPLRRATDDIGPVTAKLARAAGLDPACRVMCGIHDSNASYLRHVVSRPKQAPFAVVSSGTWTIVMARGTDLGRLHEEYDMLANVDAFGSCVATARFMGGREYAAIAGESAMQIPPSGEAVANVIRRCAMAMPSFSASGGPYARHRGQLIDAGALSGIERAALATLYCALMVDVLLDLLDSVGDVVIDGPLAANPMFPGLMAALRPQSGVFASGPAEGASPAGSILAGASSDSGATVRAQPFVCDGLDAYREAWRSRLPTHPVRIWKCNR